MTQTAIQVLTRELSLINERVLELSDDSISIQKTHKLIEKLILKQEKILTVIKTNSKLAEDTVSGIDRKTREVLYYLKNRDDVLLDMFKRIIARNK